MGVKGGVKMLIDSVNLKRNLESLKSLDEDNIVAKATNIGLWVAIKMVEVEEERTRIKAGRK